MREAQEAAFMGCKRLATANLTVQFRFELPDAMANFGDTFLFDPPFIPVPFVFAPPCLVLTPHSFSLTHPLFCNPPFPHSSGGEYLIAAPAQCCGVALTQARKKSSSSPNTKGVHPKKQKRNTMITAPLLSNKAVRRWANPLSHKAGRRSGFLNSRATAKKSQRKWGIRVIRSKFRCWFQNHIGTGVHRLQDGLLAYLISFFCLPCQVGHRRVWSSPKRRVAGMSTQYLGALVRSFIWICPFPGEAGAPPFSSPLVMFVNTWGGRDCKFQTNYL